MAFGKKYYPPPKNRLVIEKRIINGTMRKVETWNGKVARVYDEKGQLIDDRSEKLKIALPTPPLEPKAEPEIQSQEDTPQYTVQEPSITTSSNLETSGKSGLQLVPDDDIVKTEGADSLQTDASQCPECKSKNIETLLHLENATRYKCKDCNETFAVNKENVEIPKTEIPKIDDVQKIDNIQKTDTKTPEEIPGTASGITVPEISQKLENLININSINVQEVSNKTDIPKIEPPKETSNQTIAKKETQKKVEVPKEAQEIEAKIPNTQTVVTPKTDNKPKVHISKTEDKIIEDKIAKNLMTAKAEQQNNQINQVEDKKIIKENKSMAEEILEEYKREQWAKKRDFEKNIEDMARVAAENKNQISGISHKINDVEGKIGDVDTKVGSLQENFQEKFGGLQENLQEKLGNIKKPVADALGELCTGVDCIKNDLKKTQEFQQNQQTQQQTMEKQLESRFKELSERLQKLEEPTYVCDNCGQDDIRPLNSFCPNCGTPIHNWTDPETGNPISGWSPYWKRMRGTSE